MPAVFGKVTDSRNAGLDNATVVVAGAADLCRSDGSFHIDDVPQGEHVLKIVHRDYPVIRAIIEMDDLPAYLNIKMTSPKRRPDESGILTAKREAEGLLIESFEPVVAVGVSRNRDTILVYIDSPDGEMPDVPGLPVTIGGFPVRAVPMTLRTRPVMVSNTPEQAKHRPVSGGVSAAHYKALAGTLGAVVFDQHDGSPLFLSNNHIFAECSSDARQRANVGDPVIQPSALDGGTAQDVVGELSRWVPYRVKGNNLVDAAVARPLPGISIDPRVWSGGDMVDVRGTRGINSPTVVRRCGRTTGCEVGEIVDWDFTTIMDYPTGEGILYVDQLLVDMDTDEGDSGSLLLDEHGYAVGLLSGTTVIGGKEYTVANKIRNVLEMLDVEF